MRRGVKRKSIAASARDVRDRVRLAAPELEVLRVSGEESKRKGTDKLTSRQVDRIIQAARAEKRERG